MKFILRVFVIFILFNLAFTAFAEEEKDNSEKDEKDELISLTEERKETLKYGIDSEIISLLTKISDEKDPVYCEDVATVYAETNNSDIMNAAVDYFIRVDYKDAVNIAGERILNWEDENYTTLSSSLRYLSAYPTDDAEDIIMPLIEHDTHTLASAALTAIGKSGSEKSVDQLLALLDDDDYPDELKPAIIKALGDIGSETSLDLLIDILDDIDEEKSWRWNACEALGKIAHPDALPSIDLALQDSDTYLRAYAVKALSGFEGDDIEDILIQSLKDSFWRVRVSAAEALGTRKSKKAVDILIYKAKKDPEKNVKLAAVEALGEIADAGSMDFLRELYEKSNTNQAVRTKSAEILIEKDLSESLPVIIKVIDEEWEKDNSAVLNYTCKFLSTSKESRLEPLFERMLGHKEIAVRIYGIRGIQLNKFGSMKGRLEELTDEKVNNAVRKAALGALEQM